MQVRLKDLKPNPLRDFLIDPIDEESVEKLLVSINEDGFWSGVVCRKNDDGEIEIAAGHHRVVAAIRAGIEFADVFVRKNTPKHQMARVYARENATQRSDIGTSRTGSVAAAIRSLSKDIFTGNVAGIPATSGVDISKSIDTLRGQLLSDKGIGKRIIERFFEGIPGLNDNAIKQALTNLRESGHYSRIIKEVQQEIKQEAIAARKAAKEEQDRQKAAEAEKKAEVAEKAQQDAETAAQSAEDNNHRVFDFEGVSKHLRNAHQIDVFRDVVTGPSVSPHLAVEQQASLAKHIVDLAKRHAKEDKVSLESKLTGEFVKANIMTLVHNSLVEAKRETEEIKEQMKRDDLTFKMKDSLRSFSGGCRKMQSQGLKISDLLKKWPDDLDFPITYEFRDALQGAKKQIDRLLRAERIVESIKHLENLNGRK